MCAELYLGNVNVGHDLEDLVIEGGDNIRMNVKETGTEVWTGFIQFGTGSTDELF